MSIALKCNIEGCEGMGKLSRGNRYFILGYCTKHYERLKRYGDPLYPVLERNGRSRNPLYQTYKNMISRCSNKRDISYKNYGGRGIKVCDRWLGKNDGFHNFCRDIGDRPSGRHWIDRIDSNGDYEPSNCRWETVHRQQANKRNSQEVVGVIGTYNRWHAYITVNGVRLREYFDSREEAIIKRKEWEKEFGIS